MSNGSRASLWATVGLGCSCEGYLNSFVSGEVYKRTRNCSCSRQREVRWGIGDHDGGCRLGVPMSHVD